MWFLLFVSSLLISSAVGQEIDVPEVTELPIVTENPGTENPEVTEAPGVTENPGVTEDPGEPDNPDTESPEEPENPEVTETPEVIETPEVELPEPIVTISQGTVVGSVAESGDYLEFYGIPYADSTSGTHRFKAPSAPPSFEDTFIADRRGIKCVTATGVGYEGTEDCLVLNIFTTSLNTTQQLPVMVWVKGRELDKIDHSLSYRQILSKDVMVVELNFRESILGFLCLGTEIAPGNAGLKDIIAGLRWVQDNIAQFGGNPNNVSIFGHGSGAAAVDLVTMSPMSEGLVHKAIAQSGTAFAPWAVSRDNLKYAVEVAEALGHTITTIEDLSELFTRTSLAALMAVINELDLTDNSLAFAPCIERENLENVEPFLIKSPYQTLLNGEQRQIPFMTGFVDTEGTVRAEQAINWIERMDSSFTDFLQPDLQFENEEDEQEVAQQIRSFYFNDEDIEFNNFLRYNGETMILVSALREAVFRARNSLAPIYVYQFSYNGLLGELFVGNNIVETAGHSEELAYLFHDSSTDNGVNDLDLTVADILIERWTNFAKTGVPTSETSQESWQPFTLASPAYLRFLDVEEISNGNLEFAGEAPHFATLQFWEPIYEEHFQDAEGRWEFSDRDEGEELEVVDSMEEEEDEDGDETTTEDPNVPDSATTAFGCTFVIIALFSVLGQFHWSQIAS